MRRRAIGTTALAFGLLLAACGGESSSSSSPPSSGHGAEVAPPGQATPAADANATAVADLGFRPDKNGFPFPNYGPDYPGLTAADVQSVFGNGVCADTAMTPCVLTPVAQQWMDQMNKGVQGGHCYGFSVAALTAYKGTLDLSQFGSSDITQLKIADNSALQRRLAVDWAAQLFPSVQAAAVSGTPSDILATLMNNFKNASTTKETYTLLIFKRDGTGGHAITPYAIVDKGNGLFGLLAYDNNFVGTVREVLIDTVKNTWQYNAATNPNEPSSLYEGDASTGTMSLKPTTPGEGTQPCFFCGAQGSGGQAARSGSAGTVLTAAQTGFYEISLTGDPDSHAHLVFSDDAGNQTGIIDGTLKTGVAGITAIRTTADVIYKEADEPVYDVPVGSKVSITVDGSALSGPDTESIEIVGPGIDAALDNIAIDPGQKDTLALSADGTALAYHSPMAESPTLSLGNDGDSVDYSATLQVHGGSGGSTLAATITQDTLSIGGSGDSAATFDLTLDREDDNGVQTFKHNGIALGAGDVESLAITHFTKHGDSIPATRTSNGSTSSETLNDEG